jgi:nucleoside-diphosphate-sugar epimerase
MENLLASFSADGVVRYPVPAEAPLYWVATADVAGAVQRAIEREVAGWFALPGAGMTGQEVAGALTAAIGRPVRWQQITPEEFADRLRPHLGDHAADGTAAVYRMLATAPPAPAPDASPAREVLGWAPVVPLEDGLARTVAWFIAAQRRFGTPFPG